MAEGAADSPESLLEQALRASDAGLRAKYATVGLSHPTLASDTQVLLLRQLYLAHLERQRFAEARTVAEQMLGMGQLLEPAHHDVARACIALGEFDVAASHLRTALRHAPAHRRTLHSFNLGRVALAQADYVMAASAFRRAQRWATQHQALYRACEALALHRQGEATSLTQAYGELSAVVDLPLYADFLAAELLLELGRREPASGLYRRFLEDLERAPVVMKTALCPEAGRARACLG